MTRAVAQALACACIAVLAAFGTVLATEGGELDPTALVRIADTDPIAPLARAADPDFRFVTAVEHYDGVYYFAMAADPFATGAAHELIDQAAYRYGHPLHGWAASVLSLGDTARIPVALLLLGLLGIGAAAYVVSRLVAELGGSPWAGLLVPATPGLLYAVTVDTTEPLGLALVVGALLCWHRGRIWPAAVLMVLCCLDKEQYVMVPAGLALFELAQAMRARRWPPRLAAKAVALAVGPAALSLWYLRVHAAFGTFPSNYEAGNIGAPFTGWGETFRSAHELAGSGEFHASQIGATSPAVLVAYLCLFTFAAVRAVRLRTVVDATYLLMVGIVLCQGWRTLLYPHELLRVQAVLMALALLVVLHDLRGTRSGDERAVEARGGEAHA